MPGIGEAFRRPYQDAEMIAQNCDYGTIVCHCERVTLGELNDAIDADIPATSLDGLRRSTRAMQGRCQGFNCQASLLSLLRGAAGLAAALQTPGFETEATTLVPHMNGSPALRAHLSWRTVPGGAGVAIHAGVHSHRKAGSTSFPARSGAERSRSTNGLTKTTDVLIVGAGPAGLAAALELRELGVKDVIVAEREAEAGGIPRMCGHIGFGLRDFHQVLMGPSYARKYVEMAEKAGIQIASNTTITGWNRAAGEDGMNELSYTSPAGRGSIEARSILLATGVRERPRAARLVPGHRPQGVFTTGSLQRFVYEHHLPVGKRAVIVGAEIVSLSVVTTLLHAGVKVLNMITELPRHQLYLPLFLPAKIFYADLLARASILTNTRVSNIYGRP